MSTETQTQQTDQSSQGTQDQSQSSGSTAATGAASQGSTASQTTSTQTGQTQQQAAASAAKRPDWAPEAAWNPEKGFDVDAFGKHWAEQVAPVLTRDAAEQVRRAALPQKPEDVKIELPKDFQIPQGVEFKLDASKPEFGKLQAAAIKHGLSNDAVSDLVGVYAETLVGSEATLSAARTAEITKLGANGPARVTALSTFFDAMGAPEMKGMLVTAGIVQAAERLVAKFQTQGAASFSQAHREPPTGGKVTEDTWATMSDAAKLDYVRTHNPKAA
ncbi:hypothetical protein IVB43_23835 [Bradyrhizobium sp. 48]|uniref:hypothetical protein n=1 Tax=Bradyrhizobium sp. 48 TaxID=2782676 RepID=UPI001FF7334C|nr:hypothetical protein [Bradyrhizobium sp. 48]MCK1445420.1 hypothetical protein [Bradyrhizobium sp. 48]